MPPRGAPISSGPVGERLRPTNTWDYLAAIWGPALPPNIMLSALSRCHKGPVWSRVPEYVRLHAAAPAEHVTSITAAGKGTRTAEPAAAAAALLAATGPPAHVAGIPHPQGFHNPSEGLHHHRHPKVQSRHTPHFAHAVSSYGETWTAAKGPEGC
jgi:hypothetical protein